MQDKDTRLAEKKAAKAGRQGKNGSPKPRRLWRRRALIAIVVLVLLYALFGFFGVPLLIRHVGVARLQERINGTLTVDAASFNPFTFALVIEDLKVVDHNGVPTLSFARFSGNLQVVPTIFRHGYHFDHAMLDRAFARVVRSSEGGLNLAELWRGGDRPSGESSAPLRELPRVVIDDLALTDTSFMLRDEAPVEPFEKEIRRLDFRVAQFDTRPDFENTHRLEAEFGEGESLVWEGTFYVDPLSSSGAIELTGLDLPQFMPYVLPYTAGRIAAGRLSVDMDYDFAPARLPRRATATIHRARLDDVDVELNDESVLSLPVIEMLEAHADGDTQRLRIQRIALPGAELHVRRASDGQWQLRSMLTARSPRNAADPTGEEDAAQAEEGAIDEPEGSEYPVTRLLLAMDRLSRDVTGPWGIELEGLELSEATVVIDDDAPASHVNLSLSGVRFAAGPMSSEEGYETPFTMAGTLDAGGTLQVAGRLVTMQRKLDADVTAERLNLAVVSPYLPKEIHADLPPLELTSALLSLEGKLTGTVNNDDSADAEWDGSCVIESLDVASPAMDESPLTAQRLSASGRLGAVRRTDAKPEIRFEGAVDLAGAQVNLPELHGVAASLEQAAATGLDFDGTGPRLGIDELTLKAPMLRADVALLPAEASETVEEPGEAEITIPPDALPIMLRIGRIEVDDAAVELHDNAAAPPAVIIADAISFEATDLANDGQTVTELTMSSQVQGSGRVTVQGKVDPFRTTRYGDLELGVTALPLKSYDAYSGHYLGYAVETGRLTLKIPITVDDGRLDGRLNVQLDRFHLGEKIESPAAPNAPVKLGLDLLRDSDDRITADIDISGDMNDPSFRLGNLIFDAFINLILKGATAPFQALASMFGGDDTQDLSTLEFEPGSTDLTADALVKLDVLIQALRERPSLNLAVTGSYDRQLDGSVLATAVLEERLLALAQEDDPEVRILSEERRTAEVKRLFAEAYPQRARPPVPIPPGSLDQQAATLEEMHAALIEAIEIPAEHLQALARERAQRVLALLTGEDGVPSERLSIEEPPPGEPEKPGATVSLELF